MATQLNRGDRIAAGLVSGGLVVGLLWALVIGLAMANGVAVSDGLKLFAVAPPPPPPPPESPKPRVRHARPQGAAAPPNLRARPTEVVAPKPVVPPLAPPPPVVVAPIAGEGARASAGAADIAGPGTGAGGEGDGFGGGGSGDGDGDGDGAGDVPPRRIGGRLNYSDLPREAREEGLSGTVGVRFVVAANGRVPSCRVTRSSGSRLLDETTCRLIIQRYRFKPGHDARGEPFDSVLVQNETWEARGAWDD